MGTTVVVMVASFIMAIYLAFADQFIQRMYQFVIEDLRLTTKAGR